MKRSIRTGLRLIGPVLLVVALYRMRDGALVLTQIARAKPLPVLIAVLLNAACVHLKVVRWIWLLNAQGISYDFKSAWQAFMSSSYVSLLTPGRVGEVLRIQYLRHERQVSYPEGLASVVMDRLCDLYVLAFFAAIGFARFGAAMNHELAYATWGLVLLTLIGPTLFFVPGLAEKAVRFVYRKQTGALDGAGTFLSSLRVHLGPALFKTIPITVLAFAVNYSQGFLVARAMGIDIAMFDVVGLMGIASLLGLLPISVSGLGVRELFFSLAFPLLGLPKELAVSFGLVIFAVVYLAITIAGFVVWQFRPPPVVDSR